MIEFPQHNHLVITHNKHKHHTDSDSLYATLKDYLDDRVCPHCHIPSEEYDRFLQTDEIWEIDIYPKTHISFYYIAAPTFEELIKKTNKTMKEYYEDHPGEKNE